MFDLNFVRNHFRSEELKLIWLFARLIVVFRVQRYEVWKYLPNFLHISEKIPKFAPQKEESSKRGFQKVTKQNNFLQKWLIQ